MALPRDYAGQACSMARALEIVGERWTLLIVRDAFYGVRRFNDFVAHLGIPRAVLTDRLNALVEAHVLTRAVGESGRDEYTLAGRGLALWPVIRSLMTWGDDFYASRGTRRIFRHIEDDGPLDVHGDCETCHAHVEVADTLVVPGPGLEHSTAHADLVTKALEQPHRLLDPITRTP
jgi:DNA-binding HxlR family transcriptional regulator